ncbi:MAG: BACON domain-containing protein [Prevotellaceae bacterium]|nr:BACON domain-containing protein [Prevotellaceae bacterium]
MRGGTPKQSSFYVLLWIAAVAMALAGCSKDKNENPSLTAEPESISAAVAAGSYSIAVTSNMEWTATVNSEAAAWCTLTNASASGSGTITVNIAENPRLEIRTATVAITSGVLVSTVTVTQAAPYLTAEPENISAAAEAGSYSIAVTSSTEWTATVNGEVAAWCTLSNATGTGDGTVMVNVEFYAEIGNRTATVTLTAGTLSSTVTVTQQRDTPPYAASAQTWVFGEQTWSDVIHVSPACSKTSFIDSYTDPHCRNYTATDGKTCYYYNWPYVDENKDEMCPYPWRMPSRSDFETLISNTNSSTLISEWGYGGSVSGGYVDYANRASYWSSTENGTNGGYNFSNSSTGGMGVYYTSKNYGLQVRCIRDN